LVYRQGWRMWCLSSGRGWWEFSVVTADRVHWLDMDGLRTWFVIGSCVFDESWWKWDENWVGEYSGVPCLGEQVTHPFRNHVQLHGCLGIMLMVSAMSLGMFHPQSVTFTALKMSDRHACWQNGHISSMWAWIAHPGPGTPREDCRAPLCNDRSVPRCVPAQIIMLE
jgi:hypothetical protein